MASQDRSEAPTPRRRQKARERGIVARSPAAIALAAVAGGALAVSASWRWIGAYLAALLTRSVAPPPDPSVAWAHALLRDLLWRTALPVAVVLGAATAGALVAGVAQVGIAPLAPSFQWARLDPLAGVRRLLGGRALGELAKSGVLILLVGDVLSGSLRRLAGALAGIDGARVQWAVIGREVQRLSLELLGLGAVLAGVDYLLQRWRVERELRMTRQEMREELRETEGDPFWRARRRERARALARVRMMRQVERATVVVTNPTEVALALRYDATTPAPVVVAKGRWHMAERIRALASQRGIPIVPNPPLARALYAACEVGRAIPPRLYAAVAAVLSWVLRSEGTAP